MAALYIELAEMLKAAVEAGEYDKTQRLPNQEILAQEYGCGHATVSRAVKLLVADGIVHSTYSGMFLGPRAGSREKWQIKCHACTTQLEAPPVTSGQLLGILSSLGWGSRGSARGRDYFCPTHVPWGKK